MGTADLAGHDADLFLRDLRVDRNGEVAALTRTSVRKLFQFVPQKNE